ncbi:MAG TPA: pyrroline-5-carboxylate reductase [Verrucomicrobiae bacterium]|nr:pyrroline-5-carboxylate reductase [Verrucomicrobiae bacterium]
MSLQNKTIVFIGAGNMGEALIRGLLATKMVSPSRIIATDIRANQREFLAKTFGVRSLEDNTAAVEAADIVVLAVKPQQMGEVLADFKPAMSESKLVVSIAAGVTTARIERELGGRTRVVRAMPNTPALVGAGAAALAKGAYATDDDLVAAESILGAVGISVRVEEKLLDAVTALSGSGPAYVFLVTEVMIRAGVAAGLDEPLAKKLAIQTVYGAGKLLVESGEEPASLQRKVTSPGGTTEAALKVMSERKLGEIFTEAIKAAEKRSRELSGS